MARAVISGEAMAAYLRSPSGDNARMLIALGSRLEALAKAQVGYDSSKPAGRPDPAGGPNQAGGAQHLRDTIVKRVIQDSRGIVVWVGSEHWLALMHHEGTRPHVIRPRSERVMEGGRARGGILAFEIDGHTVFATVVHHPGTRPNRYLTDPLKELSIAV